MSAIIDLTERMARVETKLSMLAIIHPVASSLIAGLAVYTITKS